MSLIDLTDVTVVCSVRLESRDRELNAQLFMRYFDTFSRGAEFVFVEQDDVSKLTALVGHRDDAHVKLIRDSGCHHKTRNLNVASKLASRPILFCCDLDMFAHPRALAQGVDAIRRGIECVYPHNGIVIEILKGQVDANLDFTTLVSQLPTQAKNDDGVLRPAESPGIRCRSLYGDSTYDATGGAWLFQRRAFFDAGGWNENFLSYGFEDMEMAHRLQMLGVSIQRCDHNLYHLEHERTIDSRFNNLMQSNEAEFQRVLCMDAESLRNYADRGFRTLVVQSDDELIFVNEAQEYSFAVARKYRIDLNGLCIVLIIRYNHRRPASGFSNMLRFFEQNFDNYELRIAEVGTANLKPLTRRRHVIYENLSAELSLAEVQVKVRTELGDRETDCYLWEERIEPDMVVSRYAQRFGLSETTRP